MARKVKETPVLRGKDATRFSTQIRENETGKNRVSSDEYERAMRVFTRVNEKSKSE